MAKVKTKERILKVAGEKQSVSYKGTTKSYQLISLQVKREWQAIFKVPTGKNLHLRILCPARLSHRIEKEIKNFPDKQKLKVSINNKLILKEMLKGLL